MYHGTTALQGCARNLLIYTDGFEYHEPYIIRLTVNGKTIQSEKFVKF